MKLLIFLRTLDPEMGSYYDYTHTHSDAQLEVLNSCSYKLTFLCIYIEEDLAQVDVLGTSEALA